MRSYDLQKYKGKSGSNTTEAKTGGNLMERGLILFIYNEFLQINKKMTHYNNGQKY